MLTFFNENVTEKWIQRKMSQINFMLKSRYNTILTLQLFVSLPVDEGGSCQNDDKNGEKNRDQYHHHWH